MKRDRKIKKFSKRLIKANKKLKKYPEFGKNRGLYLMYKKEQVYINHELNRLLTPVLMEKNTEFSVLAEKNLELLKIDEFHLKTSRTGNTYASSHVKKLKGSIKNNGYMYCDSISTNFPFPYQNLFFPDRFTGTIDCLGNVDLHKSSSSANIFHTMPTDFTGQISKKGNVTIKTTKCESNFLGQGKFIISKLIGNTFFNHEEDLHTFNANKLVLRELLNDYRKSEGIPTTDD
jgi:hypothetical protein